MSWYRASTISVTNGSTAVTGAATDFIANAAIGEGLLAPDGKVYEIAAIVSATALTLGSAYLGSTASGQSYAIIPSQSYLRDLALQAATLVNDYQSVLAAAYASTAQATNPDSPIRLNPRKIAADFTIASTYNAASVGPITISEGITVTVSDNATWSIH